MTVWAAATSDGASRYASPGRAGDERRVERRAREDRAEVAAREYAGAGHGSLEVVGVVPLGRPPIAREPDGGHRDQRREDLGGQEMLAPPPRRRAYYHRATWN